MVAHETRACPPDRQPPRPVAPGGGRRRAAPLIVRARRACERRSVGGGPARATSASRSTAGLPLVHATWCSSSGRSPTCSRTGACTAGSTSGALRVPPARPPSSASSTAAPGSPPPRGRALFEPFHSRRRTRRVGPGPGHRSGLRRGQRRQACGRSRCPGQGRPSWSSCRCRRGGLPEAAERERQVLVCDDEPQILRALRMMLGHEGFGVVHRRGPSRRWTGRDP